MKKFFALLALVLGLVSCQTEPEGFDVNVRGEQDVNITVSLPESTRAGSEFGAFENGVLDTHDLRYILEIYLEDDDDSNNGKWFREVKYSNATTVSFPVRLAPGREYKFAVWADFVTKNNRAEDTDLFYETSNGLDEISILDGAPMTEARDAFYGKATLTMDKSIANLPTIKLTRPFAKVRVVATDINDIRKFGIEPTGAEVVYTSELYTSFNAVEGKVFGTTTTKTHNFNYDDVDEYEGANGEQLTVFADYILVPASGTGTIQFSLDVKDGAETIKSNSFNTAIPVEANKVTTIKGHILTDGGDISVDIENGFDGENAFVDSRNAAQSTLDNVIANTTIYLEPGVNYGTLYLRPVAGGAQTKEVDWVGNNYVFETYSLFENLTIVGAEGATVDAIEIEGGTYYNTDHSQKDTYPVMLSLIELKNVVFDGVTFTGKGGYDPQGYGNAVNLSGNNIKVDCLTFKNCVLNNNENNARLLYKTESTTHVHTYTYNGETYTFTPSLKNITITGCTLNGGYMGLELREAENITITYNEFNVSDRNILLAVNTGCTYSGNITITDNVSNNAQERFVRADGTGDAVVVISNNTLNNYSGEDADYIKVTNGNNVTIENNTCNISTAAQFISALNANGYYVVINDITISGPQAGTFATRANDNKESVINLNGYTVTFVNNETAPLITIAEGRSLTIVDEKGAGAIVLEGNGTAIENYGTLNIEGGSVESKDNGKVIVNNGVVNITGGTINGDLSDFVPDGYDVEENEDGSYTVTESKPVANIGNETYTTLQAAFDAVNGEATITLLRDATFKNTSVLAEGKTAILDLDGKTLSAADMNVIKNNGGNLTIKNGTVTRTGDVVGYSVNNASGEITIENATIARGLYTSGSKMTAINANISHEQSSRHAIYAWNCEVTINGGTYHNDNAGNATLMAAGSSNVTINGGTFSIADGRSTLGWTSCMIDQNGTAKVTIKDGVFNGGFRINSADTELTIEGGEFKTNNGSGYTYYAGTISVKGGTYTDAAAITFAEKYVADGYVLNAEGKVVKDVKVAKVGDTIYNDIDEAIAAWTNNSTLTLLSDVTLSDVVTINSTEHHILDLSTYTLTAAEGKNAFVIKACGTGDAERTAITIKADANNPGGINAGKKCVVYYKYADGGISGNDRPIIKIEGGVFTGSTSSWGTAGIYTIGTEARKCATLNVSGGVFNCSINGSGKSKLLISGGVFNYSVGSQGDSTALRLIWGGKFKTLGFMTADSNNTKFWFGSSMGNSNVGLYIDDEGYLVVGGPVITEFGDKFAAKANNPTKWSSYLEYSSAAEHGLYYTNADAAIKKHGEANVELK